MLFTRRVFSVVLLGALACVGCNKKKERLSASTFNLVVSPSAKDLLLTETSTLTARGYAASGDVDVNPTWTVSNSAVGTLNTTLGRMVIFTPAALGDVVVTATDQGVSQTSQITVVAYRSNPISSNVFEVYTDNGLPPTSLGFQSDIFQSGGLALTESSATYTTEGVFYQHVQDGGNGVFWGVTLDKNNTNTITANLSAFATVKFGVRLGRALSLGESLQIDITDSVGTKSYVLVSGSDGFNRLNTDWQEISLSLSSRYPTLNLSQIKVPFAVVTTGLTQALTFDIDAVRWEK